MAQQNFFEDAQVNDAANIKWFTVNKVPSVSTFLNHAWGVASSLFNREYSDKEIIKAWQYSCVANYMQRMGIEPKGYISRRHHHILPQIACPDRLALLTAEMKRRGLDKLHGIDISILNK